MGPLFLFLGAAGLSLLLSGCQGSRPSRPAQTGSRRREEFSREDLPPASDRDEYCEGDGFALIRQDVFGQIQRSNYPGISPLSVDIHSYLWNMSPDSCSYSYFLNDRTRTRALEFLIEMGSYDGRPSDISIYDLMISRFELEGREWGEDWPENWRDGMRSVEPSRLLSILAEPLQNNSRDPLIRDRTRRFIHGFLDHLNSLPEENPWRSIIPAVEYYDSGNEPDLFTQYLGVSVENFQNLSDRATRQLFSEQSTGSFPTSHHIEQAYGLMTERDLLIWRQVLFSQDPLRAFEVFESAQVPRFGDRWVPRERSTQEWQLFPNLPQDTPYADRQAAIDDYLGEPSQSFTRRLTLSDGTIHELTLNKYLWVGDTEVFSIDSGVPGPTTLVFSPHFDEPNPRKIFHWMKDLPLQSGRVIFIPEANRAMGNAGASTRPMNGLFNETLTGGRMDYLIVRRVEYLMGLVDGVIGVHDSRGGPFYISDILMEDSEGGDRVRSSGPIPSPFVPAEILARENRVSDPWSPTPSLLTPQVQWQIADFSRERWSRLAGRDFNFHPEYLVNERSDSADSTSGYMHLHLIKPAMTLEGNRYQEHGQLLAQGVYTMLQGYGHQIDPSFEITLANPHPIPEPEIYIGLSPDPQPAPTP